MRKEVNFMKKYELTDETKEFDGKILYRIRALIDFGLVKAGDFGGWIEKEENLSQEGRCWAYDNASVFGNANICGDAKVFGNANIYMVTLKYLVMLWYLVMLIYIVTLMYLVMLMYLVTLVYVIMLEYVKICKSVILMQKQIYVKILLHHSVANVIYY